MTTSTTYDPTRVADLPTTPGEGTKPHLERPHIAPSGDLEAEPVLGQREGKTEAPGPVNPEVGAKYESEHGVHVYDGHAWRTFRDTRQDEPPPVPVDLRKLADLGYTVANGRIWRKAP